MPASPDSLVNDQFLAELTEVARAAATAILAIAPADLSARTKPDNSPVTAADEAAEAAIQARLVRLWPELPVISEESPAPAHAGDCVLLVDPLDGTRDFMAGQPEFTVNLALIVAGRPVVGVVAAPGLGLIWRGIIGRGAERLPLIDRKAVGDEASAIRTRTAPPTGLRAVVSRSHLDAATAAWMNRHLIGERQPCGSAVKFCRIAEGTADVYPRLAPTFEWDVAAGHAVVEAAGGSVTAPDGTPLRYGRVAEGFRVPAFLAWGDVTAAAKYR